jgi:hypothetical protein
VASTFFNGAARERDNEENTKLVFRSDLDIKAERLRVQVSECMRHSALTILQVFRDCTKHTEEENVATLCHTLVKNFCCLFVKPQNGREKRVDFRAEQVARCVLGVCLKA